jgi:hypothetical protein
MADNDIRKLLDYIISHRVAPEEERQADLDATSRVPQERIEEISAEVVDQEKEAAARLLPTFAAGLRAAAATRPAPLALDDRDPVQNATADALIRFLVKPSLATVETDEAGAGHYTYRISLDWAGLERMAQEAQVNLAEALGA